MKYLSQIWRSFPHFFALTMFCYHSAVMVIPNQMLKGANYLMPVCSQSEKHWLILIRYLFALKSSKKMPVISATIKQSLTTLAIDYFQFVLRHVATDSVFGSIRMRILWETLLTQFFGCLKSVAAQMLHLNFLRPSLFPFNYHWRQFQFGSIETRVRCNPTKSIKKMSFYTSFLTVLIKMSRKCGLFWRWLPVLIHFKINILLVECSFYWYVLKIVIVILHSFMSEI